ncbi:MAG TPA: nucleotidyltransferase domain-containing protein [Spirochaetota bacterium]|nr:nucleotidyltransferase domain-containing protein [Spirochaetota bacterium]HPJ36319.1 nucleotidyltransferase domain-containing protein [Spirochaetota bacterium]
MDSQINNAINRYAELVKKTLPVDMIILYGSYARGTEHKDSDIDIAVVVEDIDEDLLDVSARLYSLCREVNTDIEPKLIVRKNNRSGFLESILKYGKVIYKN